ncbi:MAG: hypothetical protein AAB662_00835 [Patescibacteria group bacterium]
MDRAVLEKIKESLLKNEKICIAVCENPSLDEMGAGLGLHLALTQLGKTPVIVCPTEPIVAISSLVGIDKVKNNFGSQGKDLTVSFPYREGDIEKISYTLEDKFMNIIVKAGENGLSFDEKDIIYRRPGGIPNVLFTIGITKLSDLAGIFDIESLKDTMIINVDNKQNNQGFGDILLVSKDFSSVSEAAANLITSLSLQMDIDIAQNLMSGICQATDNFQHPKTSPVAFEVAAVLMKNGAVRGSAKSQAKTEILQEQSFFTQKAQGKKAASAQGFGEPMEEKKIVNPPDDWLAPKIYKGSTNV